MQCRVCDGKSLELAVDLGNQPWGNHFLKKEEIGKEPFYPLQVVYCHNCQTVQLNHTVKKEVMFADHTYLSGITKSLSEHFKNVAQKVNSEFFANKKNKKVLDIGSNDGTQLKHFQDLGYDVLGIESSKTTAKIANDANVPTLNAFFNLDIATKITDRFDVINAAGVFYHLEELHSVTSSVKQLLAKEGVFIIQFVYMKILVECCSFDQIYHEHLLYYNLKPLQTLLRRHGLELFDGCFSPIHGGSIIGYATHKGTKKPSNNLLKMLQEEEEAKSNDLSTYLKFANDIQIMKKKNIEFLEKAKSENKKVYGMGAPVKGNTLLNYFGIGKNYLDCLVEKNELRRDLYSPGQHLPVLIEKELKQPPDIYYVLAWNFKREILKNNQHLIDKGVQFYFPVEPKEVFV